MPAPIYDRCENWITMWLLRQVLLSSLFIIPVISLENYNNYQTLTFDSDCHQLGKYTIRLDDMGLGSAVKIMAKTKFGYSKEYTCEISVNVRFFVSRIVNVQSIDFPSRTIKECSESLEIIADRGFKYDLCKPENSSYPKAFRAGYYENDLKIKYHAESTGRLYYSEGFVIIVTASAIPFLAFEQSFKCKSNNDFIWRGFICDGFKNCEDGSDEDADICRVPVIITESPPVRDEGEGVRWWIIFPAAIPVLIVILIIKCKKYLSKLAEDTPRELNRPTEQVRAASIYVPVIPRNAPIMMPSAPEFGREGSIDAPPSYTSSTIDTTSKPVKYINPPPYDAVQSDTGKNIPQSESQLNYAYNNRAYEFETPNVQRNKK